MSIDFGFVALNVLLVRARCWLDDFANRIQHLDETPDGTIMPAVLAAVLVASWKLIVEVF